MTDQSAKHHAGKRPDMSQKTADFIADKQQLPHGGTESHAYPVEDKRKEVRREHTNGSTPRSDQ